MLKNLKKVLSLILVLALILPNLVFANGLQEGTLFVEEQQMKISKELLMKDELKLDLVEDYDPEEVVRIIVELNEKPVIVHATESGQSYEDMSYSQKSSIESSLYKAQEAVKNQITARNIEMTFARSFDTVFNGFSGEVRFEDIETIENIKGVKKVYISNEYERPTIEPNMSTSHDMIGSGDVWAGPEGYKGEGTVISVIDTGIDPSHKDFKLTDNEKAKIKKEDIKSPLLGKFFTEKVPYGYNYYDLNNTILDLGPDATEHGMHVAGTVTANGEIKGVAPESQVLAMKVFSNDPVYATTFDDIYLVAIEESVQLKADVINMSLGSTASFYVAKSAVDTAITNATENGIVCSISAGNSGYTQHGWSGTNYGYPAKQDPDYGVVGAPSLSKDSISVASIENNMITANYLEYSIPGVAGVLPTDAFIIEKEAFDMSLLNNDAYTQTRAGKALDEGKDIYIKVSESLFYDLQGKSVAHDRLSPIVNYRDKNRQHSEVAVLPGGATGPGKTVKTPIAKAGSIDISEAFDGEVGFVNVGIGAPEDFIDKDMSGKIALIIRGVLPFTEKIENAQAAGAAGVIIYNNAGGGDELINMQYPPAGKIPAAFIGHTAGAELSELQNKVMKFPSGTMDTPNINGGKMSAFSSWGTTPTLELKPEITAPGGQIYSTLQNDKYGIMSGTSMAAPHLAGGAALVMQYIKTTELATGLDAQTKLAKVLLMNTAKIVIEDEDEEASYPYSPRKQGAGLMNLSAAITTPVRVVNAKGEAKVELKDFDSKTFTMELTAINHSQDDVTYKINTDVLADYIHPLQLNLLSSRIVDADVTYDVVDDQITIPAEGKTTFKVTVDISGDKEVYRNMFVEGFVKLTESTDSHPELSVPFVGFYGDWNEPRILDAMIGEEDSYYEFSGMVNTKSQFYDGTMAISPGTLEGEYFGTDTITPVPSFLRNAEKVEYNILDKDYDKIRTIVTENYVRKNYIDGGRRNPYSFNRSREWNGKVKEQIVADGLYQYQIRAKLQDGDWQEKVVPFFVDTKAPEVTNVKYDAETGKLTWTVTDETSGAFKIFVDVNGEAAGIIDVKENQTEFELKIKDKLEAEGDYEILITALDNALNIGEGSISNYDEIAYIYLLEPELLELYNTKDVEFKGYVLNNNKITSVKVDGEPAEIKFDKNIKHLEGTADEVIVPGYRFTHKLTDLENGYHAITIEAESTESPGTKIDLVRRFYVDTEKPEFGQVTVKDRDLTSRTADIEINMSDNMQALTLYVFDSQEFNYDGSQTAGDFAKPSDETVTVTVDLDMMGENIIPLKLVDRAGNEATYQVMVNRNEANDLEIVANDKRDLEIRYAPGDSAESVTKDLILREKGRYGSVITWSSSDKTIVTKDGKVTLPPFDTQVTLTATIEKGIERDTKTFNITVKEDPNVNPLDGSAVVKYGEMPGDGESGYISYIAFNLKEEFKNKSVEVKINGEYFEQKGSIEGFEFRFEGFSESKPSKIEVIIDGRVFNVTDDVDIELMNNQEIMELMQIM